MGVERIYNPPADILAVGGEAQFASGLAENRKLAVKVL